MSVLDFLKDKFLTIFIMIISMILNGIILSSIKINSYTIFFINSIYGMSMIINLFLEFIKKFKYYSELNSNLVNLDKKYLISEIIEEPSFLDGKILYNSIKISSKAMNDEISKYKNESIQYKEYIETWIHEIKTPIASSKLIIENNKNEITLKIDDDIDAINNLLEQVLFYARSSNLEKDYFIKKIMLKDVVFSALKKNSKLLIENNFKINFKNLDFSVFTDMKWTDFILSQIIQNSIKYKKENPVMIMEGEKIDNGVVLFISDNGIGINEKDVKRVFEKGFTGENGRKIRFATGIGLYLSKKLCNKLGIGIEISSEIDMGTTLKLVFPKGSMSTFD